VSETPLYIPTPEGPLFGVLHRPDGDDPPRFAALMLAPGLDEKRAAHGALARLARALSAAGGLALRFDYRGTGDSAGESAEVTLGSMERSAAAAAAFLRERAGGAPLALMGFRLGASLALRLGAGLGAARVLAVAPIVAGAGWLRQERGRSALRRSMIARELSAAGAAGPPPSGAEPGGAPLPPGVAEDLGGLSAAARLVDELQALDLLAEPPAEGGPETLLVQVSPRRTPLAEIERLAQRHGARIECLNLEPFWQPLENPEIGPLAEVVAKFVGESETET
jgi:alpha/beta superfamily hydrolase